MTNDTFLPDDDGPAFPKWLKWGLIGAFVILVVGYGAIFLYAKVLNDSPDELDESDLAAALAVDDTTADEPAPEPADEPAAEPAPVTTDPPATEAPATTDPADEAPVGAGTEWTVTDDSQFGYRVKEVLFGVDTEAVGRSNSITGSIFLDGSTVTAGQFAVDVASIESDDGRRDNQFRGRIMNVDEFPEAVFTLTEPIELDIDVAEGAEADTEATGELTLKGSTNTVTFGVSARLENGKIGVLGAIPVVFEDYGIDNPSFGGVTTEDNGLLEFILVFELA